jgi:hypothetical protein
VGHGLTIWVAARTERGRDGAGAAAHSRRDEDPVGADNEPGKTPRGSRSRLPISCVRGAGGRRMATGDPGRPRGLDSTALHPDKVRLILRNEPLTFHHKAKLDAEAAPSFHVKHTFRRPKLTWLSHNCARRSPPGARGEHGEHGRRDTCRRRDSQREASADPVHEQQEGEGHDREVDLHPGDEVEGLRVPE